MTHIKPRAMIEDIVSEWSAKEPEIKRAHFSDSVPL